MPAARQWILTLSTLILAIAVCFHVFRPNPKQHPISPPPSTTMAVDLDPLLEPIASLEESLDRFSITLQRFNTTLVQYDFLQKDIERIGNLEQAIGTRLNQETLDQAQLAEDADEETKKAVETSIGQIREFQEQVQKELEQRRQMMMQLIAGLEQNVAESNPDENAVREVIGDSDPTIPPPINTGLAPATPEEK